MAYYQDLRQHITALEANNKLVRVAGNLPFQEALGVANELVGVFIKDITETITTASLINLDYMDVKTIAEKGGVSAICVGQSAGYDRVEKVADEVLKNRLLDVDVEGSRGVLVHLTGGPDLTLGDATHAGELLTECVDKDANVIYGARMEGSYEGKIEAMAIFTGIKTPYTLGKR